jgi:hypothetical protein
MFSGKMKSRLIGLAMAGAALAVPGAAMAGVVVKSSGPSASQYPVGTKLDDNASVTLQAGDVITVLTSDGTQVMRGAGTFRVGERARVTNARFSSLTRKRNARRVRTGAIRGDTIGAPPAVPNLWYVDVARSGTMCLYSLESVRLWRSNGEGLATYSIAPAEAQAKIDITFDDTVVVAAIDPARLQIEEGATYSITGPEGSSEASVTFALLSEDYERADQLAEALLAKGCTAQVEVLADRLGGPT